MNQSRREYLRQQRLRRRWIFFSGCLAFFIIVTILIVILISRIRSSNSSAPLSDKAAQSSEIDNTGVVSPEAEGFDDPSITTPPAGYGLRLMTEEDIHRGNMLLINKHYAYEFLDNDDLISMYDIMSGTYAVSGTDVMMQAVASGPMDAMLTDFYNNTWLEDLIILCGYRTKEESQELFDASAAENGLDHAERYVMRPGYSEHHSALSADIGIMNYDGTITYQFSEEPYSWITENCHKYGFIVRYPEEKAAITEIDYESWHFRYVGVPNATAMVNEGLCLEEYIDFIKNYTADGPHYQVTTADGTYDIYYAKGVQVPVPTDQEYEISGNNVDGFIITVKVG